MFWTPNTPNRVRLGFEKPGIVLFECPLLQSLVMHALLQSLVMLGPLQLLAMFGPLQLFAMLSPLQL